MHRVTWEQIGDKWAHYTWSEVALRCAAFTRRVIHPGQLKGSARQGCRALRRRDIAQQRLVNSVREALTIDVSLSSLAQALKVDEDQVLRLAEPDQDSGSDQESG